MISIGIVGIGLIGVASLIPLAHYKATEGVREERKALFGKRAYREFFVHGFDRPGSLCRAGQGTPYWVWLGGQNPYDIYNGLTGQVIPQTYCFDPHWVAARQTLPQPIFQPYVPRRGPADGAGATHLGADVSSGSLAGVVHSAGRTADRGEQRGGGVCGQSQADVAWQEPTRSFRLRDDVVVEPPDNPNDIARQTYLSESTNPSALPLVMKRLSGGSFSWMATLMPELTSTFNPINPAVALPYVANRYKLSIVVFNQRNLLSNFAEEVVAEVVPPPSTLITGAAKDIVIRELGTSPPIVENVGVRQHSPGRLDRAGPETAHAAAATRVHAAAVVSGDVRPTSRMSDTDHDRGSYR